MVAHGLHLTSEGLICGLWAPSQLPLLSLLLLFEWLTLLMQQWCRSRGGGLARLVGCAQWGSCELIECVAPVPCSQHSMQSGTHIQCRKQALDAPEVRQPCLRPLLIWSHAKDFQDLVYWITRQISCITLERSATHGFSYSLRKSYDGNTMH